MKSKKIRKTIKGLTDYADYAQQPMKVFYLKMGHSNRVEESRNDNRMPQKCKIIWWITENLIKNFQIPFVLNLVMFYMGLYEVLLENGNKKYTVPTIDSAKLYSKRSQIQPK